MTSLPATFSRDSIDFLKQLAANNSKDWFDANRKTYQDHIKAPADTLKTELAKSLTELTGQSMTGKLFRINRDLRFSKDKTPYNTHVRMAFWPDRDAFQGRQAQPPSFFLSIEADHIRLGAGCMAFSKLAHGQYLHLLETGSGEEITKLLESLTTKGFEQSKPDLVNPPRGFPKDNIFADLARYKGLAVWTTLPDVAPALGEKAPGNLTNALAPTLPFWSWLVDLHEKA
ncbi:MAG: TIGR02453 family protein [Roseibium sp.]